MFGFSAGFTSYRVWIRQPEIATLKKPLEFIVRCAFRSVPLLLLGYVEQGTEFVSGLFVQGPLGPGKINRVKPQTLV